MSLITRLSVAVLAAFAAATVLPGAAEGASQPPPPPPPPPICTQGKVLPYVCEVSKRSDLYPKSQCPNQDPKDRVLCQNPGNPPLVHMECLSWDGYFDCTALPQSTNEGLVYTWFSSTLLRVDLVKHNRDPRVKVTCRATSGNGWVTLTVTTQQNVSNSMTYWFNCAL